MAREEVDLDFEFSNNELANFLENFADKIRDGEVGLSFKGRKEVHITPNKDSKLEMNFKQGSDFRKLELEVELKEEMESTDEGRRKIDVQVV